jgi:hypothetical protein
MRIPRWLDYLIMAFTVFTAAAVGLVLLPPVRAADWLRARRRRVRVEPLPNPPWSVRDQRVAIQRAREDWFL